MSDYYEPDKERGYVRVYKEQTPDILANWSAFNQSVFAAEGREIPLKFRELMAFAVALTTQCPYCIDGHTTAALNAGASQGELAEASWVATALRAGGAYTHGRMAFKLADEHQHQH